jgi:hypothetical protein
MNGYCEGDLMVCVRGVKWGRNLMQGDASGHMKGQCAIETEL